MTGAHDSGAGAPGWILAPVVEWGEHVQASPLGTALSESAYAFPIIEGIHLLGLSVSVGLIFITDLRLMDVWMRAIPAVTVVSQLRPYALAGFAAVFVSGALLFWAEAPTVLASPAFPFKLLFIALAGINALHFERVIAPQTIRKGHGALSAAVKRAGLASLLLWTLVIACGRLIPYLPNWS